MVQKKTVESDGYQAVQLGFGEVSAKKVNKAAAGHFKKANVAPKKTLREFRLEDVSGLNVGDVIKADVFAAGDKVDVAGISKGKGYQGVIKRYGQHRLRESHGTGPTASTACARATAPAPLHGMQVPMARPRPPAAFIPASACPATWALCGSPCRT